jgi:hypothetical protein
MVDAQIPAASTCSPPPSLRRGIQNYPRRNAHGGIGASSEKQNQRRAEALMGRVLGLLAVMVIVALSYKLYFSHLQSTGSGSPAQAISDVGAKNDLIAIAQAERAYQAEHGSYASLDQLISGGAMTMIKSGREGYTYDVETSSDGFRAVAHCPATASPGCTNWAVDQTMEVRPAP